MRNTIRWVVATLLLAGWGAWPAMVAGQGALTPTGTPAPTMKTLDQVQPRIPVDATHTPGNSSADYVISSPGSYYLTGNLTGSSSKDTIDITANNVTLDLMGYKLQAHLGIILLGSKIIIPPPINLPSISGIGVSGSNVKIVHGTIYQYSVNGINASSASSVVIEDVIVSGCGGDGIKTGQGCTVIGCTTRGNGSDGIHTLMDGCVVTRCSSVANGQTGIHCEEGATITDSAATSNTQNGVVAVRSSIGNCTASYNKQNGFQTTAAVLDGCVAAFDNVGIAATRSTVKDCNVNNCTTDGIAVAAKSHILGNNCLDNSGAGIHLVNTGSELGMNRIEGNNMTHNFDGLLVESTNTNNVVVGNSATQSTALILLAPAAKSALANYLFGNQGANVVGTIVTDSAGLNGATNSMINISN